MFDNESGVWIQTKGVSDMNEQEYKDRKSELDKEYSEKKQELDSEYIKKTKILQREFAEFNNPYKIGDVIRDHMGRIEIKSIKWTVPVSLGLPHLPCCVYSGLVLNKNNKPGKKPKTRVVYQSNIITGE